MNRTFSAVTLALLLCATLFAQGVFDKSPVEIAPVGKVQVKAGASKDVNLDFRIGSEYHINSNKPNSPLLIPTVLKLNPETPLVVGDVKYPAGQDMSFPFTGNDKLNVYSGDFSIAAFLKAPANAKPGTYPVKGELRFQACDHSACFPPRTIPVQFDIIVVK